MRTITFYSKYFKVSKYVVSLYIFTYIQLLCWKRTNALTIHMLLPCNFRCKLWCKLFTGHCTQKNTTFIKSSCLRVIFDIYKQWGNQEPIFLVGSILDQPYSCIDLLMYHCVHIFHIYIDYDSIMFATL